MYANTIYAFNRAADLYVDIWLPIRDIATIIKIFRYIFRLYSSLIVQSYIYVLIDASVS